MIKLNLFMEENGGKIVGDNEKDVIKRRILKILIPVLIIAGLVVVWIIKNTDGFSKQNNNVDVNLDFELLVTKAIDLEKLKSYGVPIIIDFGADTCIPCKEMAPVLLKLNEELRGKAIVKFVDVWKYQVLAQDYPITVIPTQLFFDKDGNPYVPSEANSTEFIMYSSKDTNEHILTSHEGGITEEALLNVLSEMGMEE